MSYGLAPARYRKCCGISVCIARIVLTHVILVRLAWHFEPHLGRSGSDGPHWDCPLRLQRDNDFGLRALRVPRAEHLRENGSNITRPRAGPRIEMLRLSVCIARIVLTRVILVRRAWHFEPPSVGRFVAEQTRSVQRLPEGHRNVWSHV